MLFTLDKEFINKIIPYYRHIRHQIHANPELRYEEWQTAALVKNELEKMGYQVQTGIGKTGVVALLQTNKPGKTIALRADMDALPIEELTNHAYQSQNIGKMHACGHDGHTATLLMAAHMLMQMKDKLVGCVKLIFQPAEEGGAGAKAMIDDGVLENPRVDAIFGYHNYPTLSVGEVETRAGCIMYGNTEYEIEIQGKSGHAAEPLLAINPIYIAAQIIGNIPVLMRDLSHDEATVVTITQIKAGEIGNIIPEKATLVGTIRAQSVTKAKESLNLLTSMIENIAKEHGGSAKIHARQFHPTVNHAEETQIVLNQSRLLLGEEKVRERGEAVKVSEDFSFFLQEVPGCFYFIGNGDGPFCHNAHYDFNDEIIPIGAALFCQIVQYYNGVKAPT